MKRILIPTILFIVSLPIFSLELEYISFSMLYNDIDSETAIAESNDSMENYIYFYVREQSRLKVFAKDIDNKVSERLRLEMNTVKRDAVALCIFEPDGMIKKYEISFFPDNIVKVNDDKFYMYEDSYNALKTELVDNKSISDAISFLGNGFYSRYHRMLHRHQRLTYICSSS